MYRCGFAKGSEDSVENALQATKTCMEALLAKFPGRQYHKLYLSGKTNFRDEVATILPYKGNRENAPKPVYYDDIREYMADVYDADIIEGKEADDALGEEQWVSGKTTCIVTVDKDLDMIPGFHYNHVKDLVYYVKLDEADLTFLRQMLEGDKQVDNVPGIDGIGKAKKYKYIPKGMELEKAYGVVRSLYQKQYGERYADAVQEIATLLWIRRNGAECPMLEAHVHGILASARS